MTLVHTKAYAALCAATMIALSGTAATAAPAYVKSTVHLRSGPDTSNEILDKIPAGSLVEASNCGEWCEVTWQGKSGYAIRTALDTSGRVPAPRRVARSSLPPAGYDDDDDVVVAPPAYYGPPVVYYGYRYPYYRPYGYYRARPYYGYRYGGSRRRW